MRPMGGALEGEVAFITGGGNGIGRAVVDRYVQEGAHVAVMDTRREGLDAIAREHGDRVLTVEGDVASLGDNKAAIDQAVASFGKLDVFVGNAGITDGFRDLVDIDEEILGEAFDRIFEVNVKGYVLGARAAVPHLVPSRGCMIFTLSAGSLHPDGGGFLYVTSKHAALGIVRRLAHELAPAVRVNGVAAGPTRTGIRVADVLVPEGADAADSQPPDAEQMILDCTPLARWADPREHTGAYVLLASRTDGALITGTALETDAGLGVRGFIRTRGGDGLEARR